MAGIYIHIPFCKQACSYCDFYFVTRQKLLPDFVKKLCSDIRSFRDTDNVEIPVETLYIGGGTPSLLDTDHIAEIVRAAEETFQLNLKEFTFEINPDDVTREYLTNLKKAGVTRPSMGIQSFQPGLLQFMHRAHTRDEALNSLDKLALSDFSSYSVDLIYGNPGQTLTELDKDIDQLLRFNPPHISAYALTIEPETRLGRQKKLGRLSPLGDETASAHYDRVVEQFGKAGICQYEVSNFSKPDYEAIHNRNYWLHKNYLGFGPGAHSFWWKTNREKAERWYQKPDIRAYIAGYGLEAIQEYEELNLVTLAEERIMLGLRTAQGITEKELSDSYGYSFTDSQYQYIQELTEHQFAEWENGHLRLLHKGLKLADMITAELLSKA